MASSIAKAEEGGGGEGGIGADGIARSSSGRALLPRTSSGRDSTATPTTMPTLTPTAGGGASEEVPAQQTMSGASARESSPAAERRQSSEQSATATATARSQSASPQTRSSTRTPRTSRAGTSAADGNAKSLSAASSPVRANGDGAVSLGGQLVMERDLEAGDTVIKTQGAGKCTVM